MREVAMIRLVSLILAGAIFAGCGSMASGPREGRVVTSQYNGWTMRITPSTAGGSESSAWRARLEVWPPDRNPEIHGGIRVHFADVASSEKSIVESALQSGRRYIDASRTLHQ